MEEARALAWCFACEAVEHFDPSRGLDVGVFIRSRVLAGVLTRYRREIAYARLCPKGIDLAEYAPSAPGITGHEVECLVVRELVAGLSNVERWLMEQLFWLKRTERQVAVDLGISQQAVSLRKRMTLRKLQALLNV